MPVHVSSNVVYSVQSELASSWNLVLFGILAFVIDWLKIERWISSFPFMSQYEISCLGSTSVVTFYLIIYLSDIFAIFL